MAEHKTEDAPKPEKPKTVKVEAIKAHTYNGKAYEVGDTYDLDEALVGSLAAQGMALRTDRVEVAKKQADEQEKARKAKGDTSVKPMTTEDLPTAKPKK